MRFPLLLLLVASLVVACSDSTDPDSAADVSEVGVEGDGGSGADGDGADLGETDAGVDGVVDGEGDAGEAPWGVPLAPDSPWPKFRRDAAQTALADFSLTDDGGEPWVFQTEKGIFSSPVIDGEGNIYIGSADRFFHKLDARGDELWRFETGEIIDSSALLDDRGRVYVGSGDGFLYALDAATGDEVWRFQADDPVEANAFIRWFEGNVAIAPDGRLLVPNDNFWIYAIDRDAGTPDWRARMPDQTWSLPAVDEETGDLYIGNNNVIEVLGNTFSFDAEGNQRWFASSPGTISASPQLHPSGNMLLGGFDGYLRAHETERGRVEWEFPTRDHI